MGQVAQAGLFSESCQDIALCNWTKPTGKELTILSTGVVQHRNQRRSQWALSEKITFISWAVLYVWHCAICFTYAFILRKTLKEGYVITEVCKRRMVEAKWFG